MLDPPRWYVCIHVQVVTLVVMDGGPQWLLGPRESQMVAYRSSMARPGILAPSSSPSSWSCVAYKPWRSESTPAGRPGPPPGVVVVVVWRWAGAVPALCYYQTPEHCWRRMAGRGERGAGGDDTGGTSKPTGVRLKPTGVCHMGTQGGLCMVLVYYTIAVVVWVLQWFC